MDDARGRRRRRSLLLGHYESPFSGRLIYAGSVGTGLTDDDRQDLLAELLPLERRAHPFVSRPGRVTARWVAPETVVEVEFRGWTDNGLVRQASYKGIRLDRDPQTVVRAAA